MGEWLRQNRIKRGARLKDVGDAIGRGPQFVSDVEHGRRGHRMDPVIALLWCDYLVLEPSVMFSYLSLGDTDLERIRIQHYLETGAWATKFVHGKKALDKAQRGLLDIVDGMAPNALKTELRHILSLLETVDGALHVPQKRKGE